MTALIHLTGAIATITAAATVSLRLGLFVAGLVCLWTWRQMINPNRN